MVELPPITLRLRGRKVVGRVAFILLLLGSIALGGVAGLLFVSFLCVALLASAWDTKLRLLAAWAITAGWLVIALAGLTYARRALRAPMPFANFTRLLQQDLAAIEGAEP